MPKPETPPYRNRNTVEYQGQNVIYRSQRPKQVLTILKHNTVAKSWSRWVAIRSEEPSSFHWIVDIAASPLHNVLVVADWRHTGIDYVFVFDAETCLLRYQLKMHMPMHVRICQAVGVVQTWLQKVHAFRLADGIMLDEWDTSNAFASNACTVQRVQEPPT